MSKFTVYNLPFTLNYQFTVYVVATHGKLKTENALKTVNCELKTVPERSI